MVERVRPDLPGHVDARHLRCRHRLRRAPQRRAARSGATRRAACGRRSRSRTRCSPRNAATRRAGAWCRIEQMVRKIEVAAASRASADFLIVARTDARTNHGLDEALRRGEAYAKAGARHPVHRSPESEEEMARIGRHFDVPLLANMADGGRTPILPRSGWRSWATGSPSSRPRASSPPPRRSSASTACSGTRARSDTLALRALLLRQVLPPGRLRARVGLRQALAGSLRRGRRSPSPILLQNEGEGVRGAGQPHAPALEFVSAAHPDPLSPAGGERGSFHSAALAELGRARCGSPGARRRTTTAGSSGRGRCPAPAAPCRSAAVCAMRLHVRDVVDRRAGHAGLLAAAPPTPRSAAGA